MNTYRQGDVLLVQVGDIPNDAKATKINGGRIIVQAGEATGHHHSVATIDAEMLMSPNANVIGEVERYLRVNRTTELTHQEHSAITLSPGDYRIVIAREYTPAAILRVVD